MLCTHSAKLGCASTAPQVHKVLWGLLFTHHDRHCGGVSPGTSWGYQGRGLCLSDRVSGATPPSAVPLCSFMCVCGHMHKREEYFVGRSPSCDVPGGSWSRVLFEFSHLLQFFWAPLCSLIPACLSCMTLLPTCTFSPPSFHLVLRASLLSVACL